MRGLAAARLLCWALRPSTDAPRSINPSPSTGVCVVSRVWLPWRTLFAIRAASLGQEAFSDTKTPSPVHRSTLKGTKGGSTGCPSPAGRPAAPGLGDQDWGSQEPSWPPRSPGLPGQLQGCSGWLLDAVFTFSLSFPKSGNPLRIFSGYCEQVRMRVFCKGEVVEKGLLRTGDTRVSALVP